ncbi:MAG: glycyl-radical enzyme activating protein [Candidatus Promineifilaceae bacterium]|jgi:pyruvate formate lyase activating enzyme
MASGVIFDIKRFSIHDGPGIRTTVFLKGCPLRCAWCHNPESQRPEPQIMLRPSRCILCGACVDECPEEAISWNGVGPVTDRALCVACGVCTDFCAGEARELVGREMGVAEVLGEIQRDLAFFDESGGGVTFSGGDPLFQADFLLALLRGCKALELHTAVDTSGAAAWETLERIRPFVDLFLYDIKLIDDGRHREATGSSNRAILDNLRRLSEAGETIQLRLAIIPGINDDEENLRRTAEFAAAMRHIRGISILPFHNTAQDKYGSLGLEYRLAGVQAPSEERMAEIGRLLAGYGLDVSVGG